MFHLMIVLIILAVAFGAWVTYTILTDIPRHRAFIRRARQELMFHDAHLQRVYTSNTTARRAHQQRQEEQRRKQQKTFNVYILMVLIAYIAVCIIMANLSA